ncbi:hypothetical protein BJY24_000896 [Nocardia transvalensis]|uniref:Uncharacterized protein n=1 Tax=Nocardia transvalensis TaxID=37333 RepID=A0A7W9PAB1_9NOCA|nr:hypothetical protein [Nocardia transvalensis]MBB5912029.1 hypothetical protein [Nocardia transvalensis]
MTADRGEVILSQDSLIPGGVMYLIVSGEDYNSDQPDRRIVVEVVGPQFPAAGAYLYQLGRVGAAVLATPTTVPTDWLRGEPIATVDDAVMADIAARLARHFR